MSKPTVLPHPWFAMAERAGGVQALADAFSVHRHTIARWADGMAPHEVMRRHVNAWAKRRGIEPPFEDDP